MGEVIAYLKKTGQYDNTFIIFCSDNGAEAGRRDLAQNIQDHVGKEYDHSLDNLGSATSYVMYGANWASASATPFNRHKFTAFEGGMHVPAFVLFPGKVAPGSRSDAMGTVMDLLPTFLELAGTHHPGTSYQGHDVLQPQGVSLLPVLYGKSQGACIRPTRPSAGSCSATAACARATGRSCGTRRCPRTQRHWELFNVAGDFEEQHDLSKSNPAGVLDAAGRVGQLRAAQWRDLLRIQRKSA